MFEQEFILINNRVLPCFVIEYYDGPKELVCLGENILLLWRKYEKDSEVWLKADVKNKKILCDYLKNRIGILTLLQNSSLFLCRHSYEKESYFEVIRKVKYQEIEKEFPENITLGYNFLKKLLEKHYKEIKSFSIFSSQKTISSVSTFLLDKLERKIYLQKTLASNPPKIDSDGYTYLLAA